MEQNQKFIVVCRKGCDYESMVHPKLNGENGEYFPSLAPEFSWNIDIAIITYNDEGGVIRFTAFGTTTTFPAPITEIELYRHISVQGIDTFGDIISENREWVEWKLWHWVEDVFNDKLATGNFGEE